MKNFILDFLLWMAGLYVIAGLIDDKLLAMGLFGLFVSIYKPLVYGA